MTQDTQEVELLGRFRALGQGDRQRVLSLVEILSDLVETERPPGVPADAFLALEGALVFEEGESRRVWAEVQQARESDFPCPTT